LIPNGQNLEELEQPSSSKKENALPIFGFFARLDVKTKGLDILLKGFAQYYINTDVESELSFICYGAERGKLELLAQNLKINNEQRF